MFQKFIFKDNFLKLEKIFQKTKKIQNYGVYNQLLMEFKNSMILKT